jgi:hypothetical protein
VGGYVTALGLHELAYILARLKDGVPSLRATLDWTTWLREPASTLLVWEAFVSGAAHTTVRDHAADAATAAVQFLDDVRTGLISAVTVRPGSDVFSLAGAALLWAGVAMGTERLREAPLVVKPNRPRVMTLERVPVDPAL